MRPDQLVLYASVLNCRDRPVGSMLDDDESSVALDAADRPGAAFTRIEPTKSIAVSAWRDDRSDGRDALSIPLLLLLLLLLSPPLLTAKVTLGGKSGQSTCEKSASRHVAVPDPSPVAAGAWYLRAGRTGRYCAHCPRPMSLSAVSHSHCCAHLAIRH